MVRTPVLLAPVELVQVAVGVGTPLMAKPITPLGAAAPVDPVTVAVKRSEPPKVAVELVLMATVGITLATTVLVDDEVAPTAL